MLYYLRENISTYSVYLPEKYADKIFRPRYYKEITPEILSMDKTEPNEFTKEFIRLLKGACDL